MSDLEREILEIKALIDELRALDIYFHVFGASSHRYDIGPTLSQAEISEFERKYHIALPEDFRLYLQLVGNGSGRTPPEYPYNGHCYTGGAGPDYGLISLEDMGKSLVSGEFPLNSKLPLPHYGWHDLWTGPDSDDSATIIPGILTLNSQGCSGQTHLVVKGEDHGTIWESREWTEFRPKHLNFSQWMREWAKREIARLKNRQV